MAKVHAKVQGTARRTTEPRRLNQSTPPKPKNHKQIRNAQAIIIGGRRVEVELGKRVWKWNRGVVGWTCVAERVFSSVLRGVMVLRVASCSVGV